MEDRIVALEEKFSFLEQHVEELDSVVKESLKPWTGSAARSSGCGVTSSKWSGTLPPSRRMKRRAEDRESTFALQAGLYESGLDGAAQCRPVKVCCANEVQGNRFARH